MTTMTTMTSTQMEVTAGRGDAVGRKDGHGHFNAMEYLTTFASVALAPPATRGCGEKMYGRMTCLELIPGLAARTRAGPPPQHYRCAGYEGGLAAENEAQSGPAVW